MSREISISVIIPLYNKAASIGATLASVLAQTVQPLEVIVVDDGSTDGSAERAEALATQGVRVVRQTNGGVSRARNRGAAEAQGTHLAFLDADDRWEPEFVERMMASIEQLPDCGLYTTAYRVEGSDGRSGVRCATKSGVADFFEQVKEGFVALPSASVVMREAFESTGGFPAGMKLCEDSYLWVKIADQHPICFIDEPLVTYRVGAENRSSKIYVAEQTEFSFDDLLGEARDDARAEFIARCMIGKAITLCLKGDEEFARHTEDFYSYTKLHRRMLWRLRVTRRLPHHLRTLFNRLYDKLAWLAKRK